MYPLLHATHIGEAIALHAPEIRRGVLVSILNRIGLKVAEPGPGVREFFYLSEPYGWVLPEDDVIERIFQKHPDAIISIRLEEMIQEDTFRIHIGTDNPYYKPILRDKEMRN